MTEEQTTSSPPLSIIIDFFFKKSHLTTARWLYGRDTVQDILLFTVVCLHVDFLAIGHTKMSSDKCSSLLHLFAIFRKALSYAKTEF